MADLILHGDIVAAVPSIDPTVVEDLNALLAVQVPGLATASDEVRRAARALIRQHLRTAAQSNGAQRVTRTQGPFSYTYDFGDGGSVELLGDGLLRALRMLLDPAAGSRMVLVDLHGLPQTPAPTSYDRDYYSTPRLEVYP